MLIRAGAYLETRARGTGGADRARLADALTQLGLDAPPSEWLEHAFARPSWRLRPTYRAARVICECAAAHRQHAETGTVDLDRVAEARAAACRDLERAYWMRGTIPAWRRTERTRGLRRHADRVVTRLEWAETSLPADPAAHLPAYARRWLTVADRYAACRIGALLDDVAPSTSRL